MQKEYTTEDRKISAEYALTIMIGFDGNVSMDESRQMNKKTNKRQKNVRNQI